MYTLNNISNADNFIWFLGTKLYVNLVTGNTRYEMPEVETFPGSESVTRMLIGEYNLCREVNLYLSN